MPPAQPDGLSDGKVKKSNDQRAAGMRGPLERQNQGGSSAGAASSTAQEPQQPVPDFQQSYLAVCPPAPEGRVSAHEASAQTAGHNLADSHAVMETASAAKPGASASGGDNRQTMASPAGSDKSTSKAEALPSGHTTLAEVDLPKISTVATLAASAADSHSPGHPVLGPTSPRFPTADQAAANSIASFTSELAPSTQLSGLDPPQSTITSTSGPLAASAAPASEPANAASGAASGPASALAGSAATASSKAAAASEEALGTHLRTARPPVGHVLELRQGRAQFDRLLQVSPFNDGVFPSALRMHDLQSKRH